MLKRASELKGFKLAAQDGVIGKVKDFFFDDQHWTVRYLVADTGGWLAGRRVLIAPASLGRVHDRPSNLLDVHLTRRQIEESPEVREHEPVSRQKEAAYSSYYGWPMYWDGPVLFGPGPIPGAFAGAPAAAAEIEAEGDPHLRSMNEVIDYHCAARDGEIGHVEDFLLSDDWVIRYLLVDTRNWWPGKRVLLPPHWAESIDWENKQLHVNLDRQTIQNAPEYISGAAVDRDYEERLYSHYQREAYWHPQEATLR